MILSNDLEANGTADAAVLNVPYENGSKPVSGRAVATAYASTMRFSIDGWSVCDARICLEVFHEADCVLDCHQGALVHFRS